MVVAALLCRRVHQSSSLTVIVALYTTEYVFHFWNLFNVPFNSVGRQSFLIANRVVQEPKHLIILVHWNKGEHRCWWLFPEFIAKSNPFSVRCPKRSTFKNVFSSFNYVLCLFLNLCTIGGYWSISFLEQHNCRVICRIATIESGCCSTLKCYKVARHCRQVPLLKGYTRWQARYAIRNSSLKSNKVCWLIE